MVPIIRHFKVIVKISVILIIIFVILTYRNSYLPKPRIRHFEIWRSALEKENLKYILIWSKEDPDLDILKKEQEAFMENNCTYNNCYVTKDRNFSKIVYTDFDAVIISGRNLTEELPVKRYSDQIFVFTGKESSTNYPVCDQKFDNYFNMTWSYKLNSDVVWPYFIVRNRNGREIAPDVNVKWAVDLGRVSKKVEKGILQIKKHPVAWFASNCYTQSKRESFVLKLKHALKWYGLEVHVVGSCGTRQCAIEKNKECMKILEMYYFYLAFENSFAEDYVSEKVLKALLHYTVPVVFGGANYSRFLPPHSYINARDLGPKKTAEKMASLIVNTTAYLEYFKWHNHYTIKETTNSVCKLCERLNKVEKKIHVNFRKWWDPSYNQNCNRRMRRSTKRSRILSRLLGSTCSLDESPYLVSFFRNSGIYTVNKAFMARMDNSVKTLKG